MTSDEAITSAFRAAAYELSKGLAPERAAAFQEFLVQTGGHADSTAQTWGHLAQARETLTGMQADRAEHVVYRELLNLTISAIMTLAHFPHLAKIDATFDEARGGLQL